jgi:erythromycin esterase
MCTLVHLTLATPSALHGQVAPQSFVPTEKQIAWIRDHGITFATAEPTRDYEDLMLLRAVVGGARIVALGEATHGTHEFSAMKHRITEFLVKEMGFTVFAIEANMPEARRLNQYVLNGEGEPKTALAGLYFWGYSTEELLDMIQWMRSLNASGQGDVEFWGFDMQFPPLAMENVQSFIERADRAYLDSLSQALRKISEGYESLKSNLGRNSDVLYDTWQAAAKQVLDHLQANRSRYLETADSMDVEWLIRWMWNGLSRTLD